MVGIMRSLLTDDLGVAERICQHPVLAWKSLSSVPGMAVRRTLHGSITRTGKTRASGEIDL